MPWTSWRICTVQKRFSPALWIVSSAEGDLRWDMPCKRIGPYDHPNPWCEVYPSSKWSMNYWSKQSSKMLKEEDELGRNHHKEQYLHQPSSTYLCSSFAYQLPSSFLPQDRLIQLNIAQWLLNVKHHRSAIHTQCRGAAYAGSVGPAGGEQPFPWNIHFMGCELQTSTASGLAVPSGREGT